MMRFLQCLLEIKETQYRLRRWPDLQVEYQWSPLVSLEIRMGIFFEIHEEHGGVHCSRRHL